MSNLILTSQWNFDEISIKIEIGSLRYDLVIIISIDFISNNKYIKLKSVLKTKMNGLILHCSAV